MKETVVKQGRLAGVEKDGYTLFRGVPYAQPPVGELRWRASQEPEPWDGVYLADKWPCRSKQESGAGLADWVPYRDGSSGLSRVINDIP